MCEVGKYCAEGATYGSWCYDPGTYCPAGSAKTEKCVAGSFCPNPSVKTLCEVGNYCAEGVTKGTACDPGTYCTAGSIKAEICKAGMFCENGPHDLNT